MANVVNMENIVVSIMVLKRPILSEMAPAASRPTPEPLHKNISNPLLILNLRHGLRAHLRAHNGHDCICQLLRKPTSYCPCRNHPEARDENKLVH
jgi:hypothetical protein